MPVNILTDLVQKKSVDFWFDENAAQFLLAHHFVPTGKLGVYFAIFSSIIMAIVEPQ